MKIRISVAAITAIVAAVLSLFGIKPGPYLVGVAIVVKVIVVGVGVILGARVMRRRAAAKATGGEPPVHAAPGAAVASEGALGSRTSPDPEHAGTE